MEEPPLTVAPETVGLFLWKLRPARILGEVKTKKREGNAFVGEILILVHLKYPNGEACEHVRYSAVSFPHNVKDKVMITLRQVPAHRRNPGQPEQVEADTVAPASKHEVMWALEMFDTERLKRVLGAAEQARQQAEQARQAAQEAERKAVALKDAQEELIREAARDEAKKIAGPVLDQAEADMKALEIERERLNQEQEKALAELQKAAEEELADQRQTLRAELETVQQEKTELEARRQDIDGNAAEFARVGGDHLLKLLSRTDTHFSQAGDPVREEHADAPPMLIKGLQSYFAARDYSVDPVVLTQALLSLCVAAATGQFVLLTGPPGSGKTSLVTGLADALGAGRGVVPVRPAWIDTSDLIGFYDPRLERYQPTPFLDRIADAGAYAEANRLFFLALDEMNLGRVENYAADFLSQLEKVRVGEKDAGIELYSGDIAGRLVAERNRLLAAVRPDDADPDLAAKITLLLTHLGRYPARLSIPEGLVFFGTINVDETTNLPSPKFLDRSFVVQIADTALPAVLPKPRKGGKTEADSMGWNLTRSLIDQIISPETELPSGATKAWRDLLSWQEPYLRPLGIRLSHRLSQVYRAYMAAATVLKVTPTTIVAETFVLAKVLPLISFRDDEPEDGGGDRLKMDVLRAWRDDGLAGYPLVHNALDRILGRGGLIVRYFE